MIGGGIGLISITGAGAEAAFLPVLAGLTIPPALFLLGTYLYHNKPSYQYSIQAGKKYPIISSENMYWAEHYQENLLLLTNVT